MSKKTFLQVFHSLLEEIEQQREINPIGKISEDNLASLNYLFGDELMSALQLIDSKRIHLLESKSKRKVFSVMGHDEKNSYICFKYAYYCSCLAFKHKVMATNEWIMCKHLLASRIAESMGVIDVQKEIEDKHIFEKMYSHITRTNYQEEAHNTSADSI